MTAPSTSQTSSLSAGAPVVNPAASTVTPALSAALYAAAPPAQYSTPPVYNSDPRVKDTIELCHFAVASLNKNDLLTAKQRLAEALRRLE